MTKMGDEGEKRKERLRAAALSYRPDKDAAPRVVAKGAGKVAENIIAVAREHGVPITEDPDLVAILSKMDLDEQISPRLYEIVAELLVFIYYLKQRWGAQEKGTEG